MQLILTTGQDRSTAPLLDGPTTRYFAFLLPLTLPLLDVAAMEMVSDLTKRLSPEGAPAGSQGVDTPWGTLAIFTRAFRSPPGSFRSVTSTAVSMAFHRRTPCASPTRSVERHRSSP
ncbi:hypothetical protein MF271_23550 (plasmid) [Deinococcus sp. KNUC1210]|nr:cyclophilin-like fold protein [Deinococcus sp. KNUC1210]ULH17943.1 hypothetical protein MF271_23550 [Deinococcus sp. KNUC1210]